MGTFAVYLHPETCATSRPLVDIEFVGQSLPYSDRVRGRLVESVNGTPSLPLRQAELADFERVHDSDYLAALQAMAAGAEVEDSPRRSLECSGLEYALPGYRYSLGGLMEAVDRAKVGDITRAYCFSLPGHHAYRDWGHGYCLLNPLAAAVRYAQERGFERVLVVDWDHHHGDGTQSIFSGDESVHCISIHSAVDLYMSMVRVLESGTTEAATLAGHQNIPVLDQTYDDAFWAEIGLPGQYVRSRDTLDAFSRALRAMPWQPDLVFLFSGYDGHKMDCGSRVQEWTDESFVGLTNAVAAVAGEETPIVSVHGGGYKLTVTVRAAMAHMSALSSYPGCDSNA